MNKVLAITFGLCLSAFTSIGMADDFAKVIGVGIGLEQKSEKAFVVKEIVANSPAAKSGKISVGQMVIGIQSLPNVPWERPYGKSLEEVVNMIRGPLGTVVGLKMYNPADHATGDVFLIREEIDTPNTNGGF